MDKRGFTLVEVMAVIVILCLIMLMGVPSITKTLQRQENRAIEQFENNLCIGGKNYARHNTAMYNSLYENKGSTSVCSKDLYDKGYISSTLKNPDKKAKDESIKINMSYNGGNIKCTYTYNGC